MPKTVASLVALVVGALVAFSEVLGTKTGLLLRDHQLVFRPRWWAIRDSFLAGEIPALTIGGHGGIPIEQLMNGTWTPGALLFLLGPFDVVYDLFVVAHFIALGIGVYLLTVRLGGTRAAAITAGGFAMLAGPVLSTESLVVALIGLAYVPWVLLACCAVIDDPNRKTIAWLALALGFQAQAIIPSIAIADLIGVIAIVAAKRWRPDVRTIAAFILAGALGLGIAAIGLFPALEGLASTTRGQGFSYAVSSGWAVSPAMFLEYLAPNLWSPIDYPFLNPGTITGNATDAPYFPSLYFGAALPLIFAGAARKKRAWLVAGLVFFAIVAMGKHAPLHRFVAALPILSSSRYAVKYTLLVTLFGTALVALGIAEMGLRPRLVRVMTVVHAALTGALLLTVGSEFWTSQMFELHGAGAKFWSLFQDLPRIALIAQDVSVERARHAFVAAVGLAIVAQINVVRPNRRSLMPFVAAAIVIADLAWGATYVVAGFDLEQTAVPGAVAATIKSDTSARYFVPPYPNGPTIDLDRPEPGEQVMTTFGARGQLETPGARRFDDSALDGQSHPFHAAMSRLAKTLEPAARDRLLARVGVANVLEMEDGKLVAKRLANRLHVDVYDRFLAFEPAKWTGEDYVRFFENPDNVGVGLIEHGTHSQTSTSACVRTPTIASNRDGINGPTDVLVDATCPTFVVLQEVVKRGWSVEIDGRETTIFATDAGYIGAEVPPGNHSVRFIYRSLAEQWAPMTAIALLFVFGMLATGLIADRRSRRPHLPASST